jgi:hypothetical protein
MDAIRPTREREAPVHASQHTDVEARLKLENVEISPQSAFPRAMLQKGHDIALRGRGMLILW